MRSAFRFIRYAFELAGAVQLLLQAGVAVVAAALVGWFASIDWPWRGLVAFGVLLIVFGGLVAAWQALRQRALSFPDVELRLGGPGWDYTDPWHPVVVLRDLRFTNREQERPASLTIHAYVTLEKVVEGGVDRFPLPPLDHAHRFPPDSDERPALFMPINVKPMTSESGDIGYRYQSAGKIEGGPPELEVEEHVSGRRVRLPEHWRGEVFKLAELGEVQP